MAAETTTNFTNPTADDLVARVHRVAAKAQERRLAGQGSLFEPEPEPAPPSPAPKRAKKPEWKQGQLRVA